MKKKKLNQFLKVLAAMAMIINMMPMTVFAIDHEHDEDCGYALFSQCTHIHDETCGYEETAEDALCSHVHDEDCGYREASICNHEEAEHICSYDDYLFDEKGHWQICTDTDCAAATVKAEHHFDDDFDTECEHCGYVRTIEPLVKEEETSLCTCESDDPACHSTLCPMYTVPELSECSCIEACIEANVWCDVCGFDVMACKGGKEASSTYGTTVDGIITLNPADLVAGASGEGWLFDGSTLTISPGYTLNFEGNCDCYYVENKGTISGGTFSSDVSNYGTISDGTFNKFVKIYDGGTIKDGIFNWQIMNNSGTIEGGTFNYNVENYMGIISGGSFNGDVENTASGATIAGGTFHGDVTNYQTITGGTFSGKLTNYQGSISGITIELSNALIEGGESYGWSLHVSNTLILGSGITFYWKAGATCGYPVNNEGTITGGIFNGDVHNSGTISGGTFNIIRGTNSGTITGGTFSGGLLKMKARAPSPAVPSTVKSIIQAATSAAAPFPESSGKIAVPSAASPLS